jgi:hypothetical protein
MTGLVWADTSRPSLRGAAIGVNAQVRNRTWAPLTVHLENPGPACTVTLSGELSGEFSGQQLLHRRTVWLPARCTRRVEYPVWMDVRHEDRPGKPDIARVVAVRLLDERGRELDRTEALANVLAEDVFNVGIADSRTPSYLFLKEQVTASEKRWLTRFHFRPAALPRRPLYLMALDALILGDLGAGRLTALQERALVDWVRGGGTLFVLPGGTRGDDAVWEILPADVDAAEPVETLPALAGEYWFAGGVGLARLRLREDAVLWRGTPQRPLVAARREGLGCVVALAFDTGADDWQRWPGALEFWQDLFGRAPRFYRYSAPILERSGVVEGILSSLAGIKVLERRAVATYIGAVALAILGVAGVFRWTRRPEWGWVAAVVIAVGAATGAVGAAAIWKAQPSAFLTEAYVAATRSGASVAQVQGALGLYSPREAVFTVPTSDDNVTLRPGRSETKPPEQFPLRYDDRLVAEGLRVRADDVRLMLAGGVIATEPPGRAMVHVGAEGLRLAVTPGVALSDAFLRFNRFVAALGDLPAGVSAERAGLRGDGRYSARMVRGAEDELRGRLRTIFFPEPTFETRPLFSFDQRRFYARYRGAEPQPVVYGWSATPRLPVGEVAPRRAVGFWALEAEVSYDGPVLWLPRGVWEMRTRDKSAVTAAVGEGRFAGTRPLELVLEFSLPAGCPDWEPTEARLHLEFRGSAFRPTVRVAPAGDAASETDVSRWDVLPGESPYRLPVPARYYQAAMRRFVVAVRVEAADLSARAMENTLLGLSRWQIRECELEAKGVTR